MNPKQIEVRCPCCDVFLTIDVGTQKVLRQAREREVDETGKAVLDEGRWDQAQDRVETRLETGTGVFESALDRERSREQDLDDLFEKAKRKANRKPEDEF